jgi:hypothetical protein
MMSATTLAAIGVRTERHVAGYDRGQQRREMEESREQQAHRIQNLRDADQPHDHAALWGQCETLRRGNVWYTLRLLSANALKQSARPNCCELHEPGDSKETIESDWSAYPHGDL